MNVTFDIVVKSFYSKPAMLILCCPISKQNRERTRHPYYLFMFEKCYVMVFNLIMFCFYWIKIFVYVLGNICIENINQSFVCCYCICIYNNETKIFGLWVELPIRNFKFQLDLYYILDSLISYRKSLINLSLSPSLSRKF